MGMIDIKHFTRMPVERLKGLNEGDQVELLTYKKDRKVILIKKAEHHYDILEDGFEVKEFRNVEESKLEKHLKQLQRIEFPRSNKFFLKIIPATLDNPFKLDL